MPTAALYIVATPIGNLDDLSYRVIRTLKEVDLIAAEDTRRAGRLLAHCGINKKELISYHDHVEVEKAGPLVRRILDEGLTAALISDAGTPCISDPGYRLVAEAKKAGLAVHPVPGPSALTTLVCASGLPSDRFLFVGFLPGKEAQLKKEVQSWRDVRGAVVFYESPRRLKKTLAVIAECFPHAEVAIGRELTKLHEEIVTTSVTEAEHWAGTHATLKGEAVVMVHTHTAGERAATAVEPGDVAALVEAARRGYQEGLTLKDLLGRYQDCGFSRSDLYRYLLEAKASVDQDRE